MSISVIYTDKGDTIVKAGEHVLAIFGILNEKKLVDKFIELCKARSDELTNIGIEYEEKRNWNFAHHGQGKNWPIFSKREKLVDKLCDEAGLINN